MSRSLRVPVPVTDTPAPPRTNVSVEPVPPTTEVKPEVVIADRSAVTAPVASAALNTVTAVSATSMLSADAPEVLTVVYPPSSSVRKLAAVVDTTLTVSTPFMLIAAVSVALVPASFNVRVIESAAPAIAAAVNSTLVSPCPACTTFATRGAFANTVSASTLFEAITPISVRPVTLARSNSTESCCMVAPAPAMPLASVSKLRTWSFSTLDATTLTISPAFVTAAPVIVTVYVSAPAPPSITSPALSVEVVARASPVKVSVLTNVSFSAPPVKDETPSTAVVSTKFVAAGVTAAV